MTRLKLLTVLIATASTVLMLGPGSPQVSASTKPTVGGSITIGGYSVTSLDPFNIGYTAGNDGNAVGQTVYGSLFLSPSKTGGQPVPNLATGYSYNKAATKLTINLRHGLRFQDGSALDAAAVVWNMQRADQPTTGVYSDFNGVSS